MSNLTSTLDVVLQDDVTRPADRIAASLAKMEAEAKAIDAALAKSGGSDKFQSSLKRLGADVVHIDAVTKAMEGFARAEGLAGDRAKWTTQQGQAFRNMEGVTIASLKAIMGQERALDAQRMQAAAKAEEADRRRVESARRAAEQMAEIEHRRIEQESRDNRLRLERYERDQRREEASRRRHEEMLLEQRQHAIGRQGFVHFGLSSAAMAVSAHEIAHVGAEAWREGAELHHERIGLRNAGRTPEEMRAIEAASRNAMASLPTAGMVEGMKVIAETTGAFGSVDHAIDKLPFMMQAMAVLKAAGGEHIHGDAGTVGRFFAKTFEERQTRPEDFEKEARQMIPAMVASGGVFNPQELYAFAQQAKSALPALSMRFLSRIAPSIIGANGGERAGTALNAFESVISGKANDKKQAEMWMKLGLLDPSKTIMKAGHATSWQSGAVKDTLLAMSDPLAWAEKYLVPAMKKAGTDPENREAVKMILDTMFRNQNANLFASEITQAASRARLHKDEGLYNQAGSLEEIYTRDLGDFSVASGALGTALKNLAAAATAPLMHGTAQALSTLAGSLNELAKWGFEHPTIAATGGIAAGGAALAGAGYMSYQLMNGFGLGTSAHLLDAAAMHLMEVGGGPGLGGKLGGAAGAAEGAGSGAAARTALMLPELAAGGLFLGGMAGLGWVVDQAIEAQQPGKGGQWAPPTERTRALDEARLADQKAELADVEHQMTMNKARSKNADALAMLQQPLLDRAAELRNQIANLERGFSELGAYKDRETERGRAFGGLPRPEEFGPDYPRDRPWKTREEFGPPMPPKPVAPDPWLHGDRAGIEERSERARDEFLRDHDVARGRRMMELFGATPKVDTSGIEAVGAKAQEAQAQLQRLNMTVTPTIGLADLDALIAKAHEARAALASLGGVAASPRPSGSIQARLNGSFTHSGATIG